MTKPKQNLCGQKFGRLEVICQAEDYIYPNGKRRTQWKCLCDCGNTVIVEGSNLKKGNSKSCGCLNDELIATRSIKHGDRHTKLYCIWTNMKTRCNNQNSKEYDLYGGRGISVCEEWNNSYSAFKEWAIDSGYFDKVKSGNCSIDRIDVNKGYCPDNCRWATAKEQANNRQNTIYITFNNETKTLSEWATFLNIKYHTLFARIYRLGWSVEKAFTI